MTMSTMDQTTGLTSCCRAMTTISQDDGVECCQVCWDEVISDQEAYIFWTPSEEEGGE